MPSEIKNLLEVSLPYLLLLAGMTGSMALFGSLNQQVRRLRRGLAAQEQLIEVIQSQLRSGKDAFSAPSLTALETEEAKLSSNETNRREQVLELLNLGRTPEDIADETGLSCGQVGFLMHVESYLGHLNSGQSAPQASESRTIAFSG